MERRLVQYLCFGLLAFTGVFSSVGAQTSLPLMPMPAHVVRSSGEFVIDGGFGVVLEGHTEPRLERAKRRFLQTLSRETGIPLRREATTNVPHFIINTAGPSEAVQQLGEDESYRLQVTPNEVRLEAPNPLGVLRGLQTFLQLVAITPRGFAVSALTIDDKPRFPWRGLMIDSGRHFIPLDVIERNLDGMEAVKMNVFHWHLSEDQGFRAESKLFPLLQEKGSDGLYYSQQQIRALVEYARDRGIRVVPEFDMPGHTTAWFVGYPDLASGPGPYKIERHWGIFDPVMDPTRESTYEFLNKFIGEIVLLFPDQYFHIGGDECNGKAWDANPRIQQFMRARGIRDNAALQAYFTAKVQKIVAGHHKIMEGWDEVLQPDTPKDVVIQSWRGQDSLADGARRGYRGLLSAGYYIDLNQSAAEHYAADPLKKSGTPLTPEQEARILGGEATMWSEFTSPENIDSRIWPRTAAIAERLWSPQQLQDVDSMYQRLALISEKLEFYKLQHRTAEGRMLRRMSGELDPTPLKALASAVEPPKLYVRESLREYDSFSPLNRLVDAVPPESEAARQFTDRVKRIANGIATDQDWEQVRKSLVLWRDNDGPLQPLLAKSELTADLASLSRNLREVATLGLAALDNLQSNRAISAEERQRQISFLKTSEAPQAVLLNMVAPAVELLVQKTASQ